MNSLLLGLAILPGLVIAGFIWWHDRYEREPHDLIIGCFVWGALGTLPVALVQIGIGGVFNPAGDVIGLVLYAFGVVALTEELAKYLVVRWYVYPHNNFNEPYDGIVYTVMVAMGFATLENVLYVFTQDSIDASLEVALMRMLTAVPMHGANGVLMGYYLGLAKFHQRQLMLQFLAFAIAVGAHGLYDMFLFIGEGTALASGALVVLAGTLRLSIQAIRLHKQRSPFRSSDR